MARSHIRCAGLRCAVLPVFSRTSSRIFIITIVQYYSKKASHAVAGKLRDAAVNFKRYEVCNSSSSSSSSSTAEVVLW